MCFEPANRYSLTKNNHRVFLPPHLFRNGRAELKAYLTSLGRRSSLMSCSGRVIFYSAKVQTVICTLVCLFSRRKTQSCSASFRLENTWGYTSKVLPNSKYEIVYNFILQYLLLLVCIKPNLHFLQCKIQPFTHLWTKIFITPFFSLLHQHRTKTLTPTIVFVYFPT